MMGYYDIPKRTCSKCGHFVEFHGFKSTDETGFCLLEGEEVRKFSHTWICGRKVEDGESVPPLWIPRYNTIEQRYQQLEQIAKGMQKCLAKHAYDLTQVAEETAVYYREQLEQLGVEVDG